MTSTSFTAALTPSTDREPHVIRLKVFWKTTHKWDKASIAEYSATIEANAIDFQASYKEWWGDGSIHDGQLTCEDFALKLLIAFASSRGLPLKLRTGSGIFRNMTSQLSQLDIYPSNEFGFENFVMPYYGAPDMLINTVPVPDHRELLPGDILLRRDKGHVQVVMSNQPRTLRIKQGNFAPSVAESARRRIIGKLNQLVVGSNQSQIPHNSLYLGTEIQDGEFTKEPDDRWSYRNITLIREKDYRTYSDMTYLRRWNFPEFNK